MNKESGSSSEAIRTIAMLVAGGFLANIGTQLGMSLKEKYDKTRNMKKHWEKVKAKFPEELSGEDENQNFDNYESLYSLAPTIAKIPGLSIHFLRMAKEYSTGGLDPSTIGTLAKAESDLAAARERGFMGGKAFGLDKKQVADMVSSPSIPTIPLVNTALMG